MIIYANGEALINPTLQANRKGRLDLSLDVSDSRLNILGSWLREIPIEVVPCDPEIVWEAVCEGRRL